MTIRDKLAAQFKIGRRAYRAFLVSGVVGCIVTLASAPAAFDSDPAFAFLFSPGQFLAVFGFLGAVFFGFFTPFRVRCPKCHAGFGLFQRLKVPDKMKLGPFCGVDLDTEA